MESTEYPYLLGGEGEERGGRPPLPGVTMESTEYPYLLGGEGEERGGRGSYNGEY